MAHKKKESHEDWLRQAMAQSKGDTLKASSNNDEDTMLREIQDYVEKQGISIERKEDYDKKLVSPYAHMPGFMKGSQEKKAKKKMLKQKKLLAKPTTEDLINYYTDQHLSNKVHHKLAAQNHSQEALEIKAINMPYADTIMKINETINLIDHIETRKHILEATLPPPIPVATLLSTSKSHHPIPSDDASEAASVPATIQSNATLKSHHVITASHIRNRYPRLCRNLKFDDHSLSKVQLKSDTYIAKFIEECYDEAFLACNTEVSEANKRKRCGLFLGSLDSFPLLIQRLLSRTFSVLEVRENTVLSILLTIENSVYSSETVDMRDDFGALMINGCRCTLFGNFLSEEYDLAYLALFLNMRDRLERYFDIKLKDYNSTRLWIESDEQEDRRTHSLLLTQQGIYDEIKDEYYEHSNHHKVKVVPVKIPRNMQYLPDACLREAPLLAFDPALLSNLLDKMMPQVIVHGNLKSYCSSQVHELMRKLHVDGVKRQGTLETTEELTRSNLFIPLYTLLYVVVDQWRQVPMEQKFGLGALGQSIHSLKKLNGIYDRDCEAMKRLKAEIYHEKINLKNVAAKLLRNEKLEKRLDRKWKEKISSAAEQSQLANTRIAITETKAEKSELENKLTLLLQKERLFIEMIDNLWEDASAGMRIEEVPELEFTPNAVVEEASWRKDSENLLLEALRIHEANNSAIQGKKQQSVRAVEPAAVETVVVIEQVEAPVLLRTEIVDKEPSFSDLMAELQKDVEELSAIGADEAKDLGMESVYERELAIKLKAAKELELLNEQAEVAAMATQDILSEAVNKVWKQERIMEEQRKHEEYVHNLTLLVARDEVDKLCLEVSDALAVAVLEACVMENQLSVYMELAAYISAEVFDPVLADVVAITMNNAVERANKEEELAKLLKAEEERRKLVELVMTEELALECSDKVCDLVMDELLAASAGPAHDAFVEATLEPRIFSGICDELIVQSVRAAADGRVNEISGAVADMLVDFVASYSIERAVVNGLESRVDEVVSGCITTLQEELINRVVSDYISDINAKRQAAEEYYRLREMEANAIATVLLKESVLEAAEEIVAWELRDPFAELAYDPSTFLSPATLHTVDVKYKFARLRMDNSMMRTTMRVLRRGVRMQKIYKQQKDRFLLLLLSNWNSEYLKEKKKRDDARLLKEFQLKQLEEQLKRQEQLREKQQIIQAVELEQVLLKRRAHRFVLYWHYRLMVVKRKQHVVHALKERRLMICYFTWKLNFKTTYHARITRETREYNASTRIQSLVRVKLAGLKMIRRKNMYRIVKFIRYILAKRRVRKQVMSRRRLVEYAESLHESHERNKVRVTMRKWLRLHKYYCGLEKLNHAYVIYRLRANFTKIKIDTRRYFIKRTNRIIRIQSACRMLIVKQSVLHYYKWRRGMVALQANIRRKLVQPQFYYDIYYYKLVKRIQRLYRGFRTRSHLVDKRIIDLHYAASTNKYERLKYYCNRFPELITELDAEGNTALHNAAKNSCKRTLKLLLKMNLDPNALNLAGYSALHLVIMSPAIGRDDLCFYMLERGFDEFQLTPDGKSCLHLSVEYGRGKICRRLLELGSAKVNTADHHGTTPLQAACTNGFVGIVKDLIDYGADVNMPGYCGAVPFHDVVASGSVEIVNMLFNHGAYINVTEPYHYQTPLMWACQAGLTEIVKIFLFQGADVNIKDYMGWTCVHHAGMANDMMLYELFRDADAHFDELDNEGNTPLHVAAEYGSVEFANALLEGCCNPSIQNLVGNQPAHIACRDNKVEILKLICKYDEHLGRVNHAHQTPMGVALYHQSFECQRYLEYHFRKLESDRNDAGDIWWDHDIDEALHGWRVVTSVLGERTFVNDYTGETSALPPSIPAEAVHQIAEHAETHMVKKIVMVNRGDNASKHTYELEYIQNKAEVAEMQRLPKLQVIIAKYWRRKLAYLAAVREKYKKKMLSRMAYFLVRRKPRFMAWKRADYAKKATAIMAAWRGYYARKTFYHPGGQFDILSDRLARLRLKRSLWRLWRRHNNLKFIKCLEIAAHLPKTLYDWQPILVRAHFPRRTVGVYEEYLYPDTKNIYFYRHKVTGDCVFKKPNELKYIDDRDWAEAKQRQTLGYTRREENLVIKLQALYRGFSIRSYFGYVEKAMDISAVAQAKYMKEPDLDSNLYNYALFCHCMQLDYERARFLYAEAIRRMIHRGPDVAFILYSFSIFNFVTGELDYSDICMYLERARKAEEEREIYIRKRNGEPPSQAILNGTYRHGKVFDFANVGFFLYSAKNRNTCESWQNYAVCRFLVYNDFKGSFDAFLNAFRWAPTDKKLKANFDIMMKHFWGNDKEVIDRVIKGRMEILAQRDAEYQNVHTWRRENAEKREKMAKKIQRWYIDRKSKRAFYKFMAMNRQSSTKKKMLRGRAKEGLQQLATAHKARTQRPNLYEEGAQN